MRLSLPQDHKGPVVVAEIISMVYFLSNKPLHSLRGFFICNNSPFLMLCGIMR